MLIRVDTTNLTRGLDFEIAIYSDSEPSVSLYFFDTATHEVSELSCTIEDDGVLYKALSKASSFDGYLLAKINSKSMIVKKIGFPTPHFVMGYKADYTIPYKLFDEAGAELESNNLINIIDGFYYCKINYNISIMQTLNKRFIIKENILKLNYDTYISSTTLPNIELPDVELSEISLPNIELPQMTLANVELPNVELPNIEIMEY